MYRYLIIPSLYHYLRPAGNRGIPPFLAVACLCISDKLGDIQFIVRKTHGPKVRAAERASGRFIGSCPNSIYSVYVN
jgi:hypothetical protein